MPRSYGDVFVTTADPMHPSARATSAAPTYFEPFAPAISDIVLLDGGLYNNNPIKIADAESRAIWPDNRQQQPDIILSLGTGFEEAELTLDSTATIAEPVPASEHRDPPKERKLNVIDKEKILLRIPYDHVMNGMLNERAWHEWLEVKAPRDRDQRRYRRLNIQLTESIELDNVDKLESCRDSVREWAKSEENKNTIADTANHLLSSCFYYRFEKDNIRKTWDERYRCEGKIFLSLVRLPRTTAFSYRCFLFVFFIIILWH